MNENFCTELSPNQPPKKQTERKTPPQIKLSIYCQSMIHLLILITQQTSFCHFHDIDVLSTLVLKYQSERRNKVRTCSVTDLSRFTSLKEILSESNYLSVLRNICSYFYIINYLDKYQTHSSDGVGASTTTLRIVLVLV